MACLSLILYLEGEPLGMVTEDEELSQLEEHILCCT